LVVELVIVWGKTDINVSLIGIERREVFEDFGDLADIFMFEDLVHGFEVIKPVT
jgi:hypothetical protein